MKIGGYHVDEFTKKKDSIAWKNVKKIAKRRHANFIPVAIHASGKIICMSLIRGNYWLI
jgi:hypothetical protein